ncbi:relaxase/mobilization nuclease domain-containing protein [Segetibacter koreensis]|uniref:relaxase/mobilization nuclease domain-containing protein n=1 Tax=Segetibacter koreensis TaxID=398037 RepID=UPI00035F7C12|nr:relaxase/mobilization nuclease domain-containing protein [Segetibacter koreensis]
MIGKISISSSFRSCITYCLEDKKLEESRAVVSKNRAEPIAYNQCFEKKNELIEQFNNVRALNQEVQKPVLHIMLSFAPEDKLDKGKLTEMAGECAKEMGFQNNQYIVISHNDTDHPHIHIVANREGYDGKVVSDSQNFKKIAGYCRTMELKYGLKQVLSPKKYLPQQQRNLLRMDSRKEKLKADIKACLSASKNYDEFEHKIKQKGYEIIKGRGISFTDKQAVKTKGSEVGFSLQRIEKILDLQQQLKQGREEKTKQTQSPKLLLRRHELYDRGNLMAMENFLTKTINILLSPPPNDDQVPKELLEEHRQEERKKRKLYLSQHR